MTEQDLNEGRLYPSLNSIGEVSFKLAVQVTRTAPCERPPSSQPHTDLPSPIPPPYNPHAPPTQLPPISQIMKYAYQHNQATLRPEPSDKEAFVRSLTYSTDYDEFVVDSYRWPDDSMAVQSCKL